MSTFHLATAGTSVLQSEPGATLHTVTVNTGQSGATLTLYDGPTTTGPVIAAIAAVATVSLRYDAVLAFGLTAVVAGTTAPDITIVLT